MTKKWLDPVWCVKQKALDPVWCAKRKPEPVQ